MFESSNPDEANKKGQTLIDVENSIFSAGAARTPKPVKKKSIDERLT